MIWGYHYFRKHSYTYTHDASMGLACIFPYIDPIKMNHSWIGKYTNPWILYEITCMEIWQIWQSIAQKSVFFFGANPKKIWGLWPPLTLNTIPADRELGLRRFLVAVIFMKGFLNYLELNIAIVVYNKGIISLKSSSCYDGFGVQDFVYGKQFCFSVVSFTN